MPRIWQSCWVLQFTSTLLCPSVYVNLVGSCSLRHPCWVLRFTSSLLGPSVYVILVGSFGLCPKENKLFRFPIFWHSAPEESSSIRASFRWDRRGRVRMVVGFTTTYAISVYHHWCCEFKSRSGRGVQHYVIKFVSDLRQVGGFFPVLRFPSPIKLTSTIWLKYCWKCR
jgi:hypothetical protein